MASTSPAGTSTTPTTASTRTVGAPTASAGPTRPRPSTARTTTPSTGHLGPSHVPLYGRRPPRGGGRRGRRRRTGPSTPHSLPTRASTVAPTTPSCTGASVGAVPGVRTTPPSGAHPPTSTDVSRRRKGHLTCGSGVRSRTGPSTTAAETGGPPARSRDRRVSTIRYGWSPAPSLHPTRTLPTSRGNGTAFDIYRERIPLQGFTSPTPPKYRAERVPGPRVGESSSISTSSRLFRGGSTSR